MNLQEYAPQALRTAKLMDERSMLLHGALGVMTEAGEFAHTAGVYFRSPLNPFDFTNAVEELGDGCWFGVYTANAIGLDLPDLALIFDQVAGDILQCTGQPDACDLAVDALYYSAEAEKIGTAVKAHVFYGKDLDRAALTLALFDYFKQIYRLSVVIGVDFTSVLEQNVEKLRKRYPAKYSDEQAISRADKTDPTSDHAGNGLGGPATAPWPFPTSASVLTKGAAE